MRQHSLEVHPYFFDRFHCPGHSWSRGLYTSFICPTPNTASKLNHRRNSPSHRGSFSWLLSVTRLRVVTVSLDKRLKPPLFSGPRVLKKKFIYRENVLKFTEDAQVSFSMEKISINTPCPIVLADYKKPWYPLLKQQDNPNYKWPWSWVALLYDRILHQSTRAWA